MIFLGYRSHTHTHTHTRITGERKHLRYSSRRPAALGWPRPISFPCSPSIFLLPELPAHEWNQGFPTKLKRTWWPNFTSMQIITDSQQTLDTISCCLVKCDTDGWGNGDTRCQWRSDSKLGSVSGQIRTHKICATKIVCSMQEQDIYAVIGL